MNYIVAVCGVLHRMHAGRARGPIAQPGIDTRSYAIINVSFASGIDRPLYWQFIHRSPFSSHHCGILARSIHGTMRAIVLYERLASIHLKSRQIFISFRTKLEIKVQQSVKKQDAKLFSSHAVEIYLLMRYIWRIIEMERYRYSVLSIQLINKRAFALFDHLVPEHGQRADL